MKPHTCPQGEEGIKGEKGMRGLWGQVVIYHTQMNEDYFLYPEMLQICINDILCQQGDRGPKGLKGLRGAAGFKVNTWRWVQALIRLFIVVVIIIAYNFIDNA